MIQVQTIGSVEGISTETCIGSHAGIVTGDVDIATGLGRIGIDHADSGSASTSSGVGGDIQIHNVTVSGIGCDSATVNDKCRSASGWYGTVRGKVGIEGIVAIKTVECILSTRLD